MSLFILSGTELIGTVHFEGPLGQENEIESGQALQQAIDKFDQGHRRGKIVAMVEQVDFEHLNLSGAAAIDEEEYSAMELPEDETANQRRERRANERKKALEARQRKEHKKISQKKKIREEGEPFQRTVKAVSPGWYRFCFHAGYQVVVEMDLRKESEMGGFDENGHVWTHEQKMLEEEDKMLEEDTAVQEGIKDEDFQSTREKLKSLRRLLADIQNKQQQERHRLIVHAATNEHSHSRMVFGSLMETLLFIVVTSFQVYTIRKWFKGAPVLGR
jgi:hypothetical protein